MKPSTSTGRRSGRSALRRPGHRAAAAAAAALLLLGAATTSQAATKVTGTNPGGLTAVGPVNAEYGFPAWYQDKTGVRVEPCLDGDDPLCGFLAGDIPNPDAPISFPDNFPAEFFYQLISSSLTLPGGGKANLTLGLEASFANGDPIQGDQVTFARTRVTVVGGPANQTLTFKHPFGTLTIDTDASGRGRLVQDITPAVGNFSTALSSNFGPFLKWDPSVAPAAPAGYLGDPAQTHTVVGGLNGVNTFSAANAAGTVLATNDQFGVSGKVATNTGVTADRAVVNGSYLDVFASSTGSQLQVDGVDGQYATTPMTNDPVTHAHYARIALTGAKPTSVTVRNLGDKPASTAKVALSDLTVKQADYDGSALIVRVSADSYPVTVAGIGTIADDQATRFELAAPPAAISVKGTGAAVSYPVSITGGMATDPGLPAVPPSPAGPPVYDNTPDNPTPPPAAAPVATVADPAATLPGGSVTLDASASTGTTSYSWTVVSPSNATFSGSTTSTAAKPTLTLPYATSNGATAPADAYPTVSVRLTVTGPGGTDTKTVTVPVKKDVLAIGTARHKIGTELRIDGTSLIDGQAGVLTPATSVVIWDTTKPTAPVKLGSSAVDTLGAWSLRIKPGPSVQITSVLVQSTRGGTVTSAVTNR